MVLTLMLFQFVTRKVNLDACLFAGIPRVSVFWGVRSARKFLPLD